MADDDNVVSLKPPPSMARDPGKPTGAGDVEKRSRHLLIRLQQIRGQLDTNRERLTRSLHMADTIPVQFEMLNDLTAAIEAATQVMSRVTAIIADYAELDVDRRPPPSPPAGP